MGKIFKVIPLVVVAVFGVSLMESLFILPAHLGHRSRSQAVWPLNHLEKFQERFSRAFESFVPQPIRGLSFPCPAVAVQRPGLRPGPDARRRRLCGLGPHGDGALSPGGVGFCLLRRHPALRGGQDPDRGRGENAWWMRPRPWYGENSGQALSKGVLSTVSGNTVTVRLYLTAADKRPLSTSQVSKLWRERSGTISGLESLRFESNMGGPGSGKNLNGDAQPQGHGRAGTGGRGPGRRTGPVFHRPRRGRRIGPGQAPVRHPVKAFGGTHGADLLGSRAAGPLRLPGGPRP